MIEVLHLTKTYDAFVAVDNLSFTVKPGELLGLVGPNGAGKTSALRCVAGMIPPTQGQIRLNDIDLATDPVTAKRGMAFFPDEPRLFEYLTVNQHLEWIARLYQVEDASTRASELLKELDLTQQANLLSGELSRGMKQKVALACGLLHSPAAILFDEPLTGLDPLAIRRMKDTIRRLSANGAAIVISSHLLPLLEELCTHVLILNKGHTLAHGTLNEVRNHHGKGADGATLEDVFLRIASEPEVGSVPPPLPPPIQPPQF